MPEYLRVLLTAGLAFLGGYWLRSLLVPRRLPVPEARKPRSITTTFTGDSIKTTLE